MARTNPPYYYEEEDEQTRREDELLSRGMNPDLANEEEGNAILSGGINPDLSNSAFANLFNTDTDPLQTEADDIFSGILTAPPQLGTTAQTLQQDAQQKRQAADQAQQNVNELLRTMNEEELQRAEALKPHVTQEELDSRRAKSTALSMLTSALANVANGIAVGKGGLNATVPDGYTAAYEHWNDVQKRHNARQAEYQKLVDAVNTRRYGAAQAEAKRLETEAATAEGAYNRYNLEELRGQNAITLANIKSKNKLEEIKAEEEKQIRVKTTPTPTKPATRSGGRSGGSKAKTPSTTFTYQGNTYTTPSGVSIKQALQNIAEVAKNWLRSQGDLDDNISKIDAAFNYAGDFTDTQAKAILKAISESGWTGDIQGIMDAITPQQTTTTTTTNNRGNGGTQTTGRVR